MPLMNCKECLGEISERAYECPKCGVPIRDRPGSKNKDGWQAFGSFIVAFVVGYVVACVMTTEDGTFLTTELVRDLRPSQEIVNSSHEIDEGHYFVQLFELYTDANVRLQINAKSEPVNVMLMTHTDWEEYREAFGRSGSYKYRSALSEIQVLRFDKTEMLSQGKWAIVVERPSVNGLFQESIHFDIIITVH